MYKDVLDIIGLFSNMDLHNFKYGCDECNDKLNYEEMITCIYKEDDDSFSTTLNDEIEFFISNYCYDFKYICPSCYDSIYKYKEIVFLFPDFLELESVESLHNEIIKIKTKEILKNCIINNISISENNQIDNYKTLFTLYNFNDNQVIERTMLYMNDEPFDKYYDKLSKNIKKLFVDFKVEEFYKLV